MKRCGSPKGGPYVQSYAARKAPYVAYWPRGVAYDAVQYYEAKWNHTVAMGAWTLNFNDVLYYVKY